MSLITEDNALGTGSASTFSFTFKYVKESDVYVSVDDVVKTKDTHYTFAPNTSSITFLPAHIPALDARVRIFRETSLTDPAAEFFPGSAIRAQDLNANNDQVLFSAQERKERSLDTTGGTITGDVTVNGDVIFEGLTEDANETTLTVVDPTQDNTITLPNASGHVPLLSATSTTQIAVTPEDINKVGPITDGTVAASKAVVVDSNLDVSGFRNVGIDGLVTVSNTTDNTLGTVNSGSVQLTGGLGVAGNATFSNVRLTQDLSFTADKDILLASGASATNLEFKHSGTTDSYLTFDTTNAAKRVTVNQPLKLTNGFEIVSGNTTTSVTATGANLNITAGMTKKDSSNSGVLDSTSDTEFPTSKVVADYVTTQLGAIDGFVAVAAATDVPGATGTPVPLGVTISIADAGDIPVDSTGQAQYTAIGGVTNVSGQVTITGIPPSFRPNTGTQDVVNGVRFLIEGTGNAGSYTYHKATLKEDDLVQLSDDINDFNERYRTDNTGQNPQTNNDSGDLFFNQTTGKMLVYNGLNSAWEEVQSIGEFFEVPANELTNFTSATPSATTTISNAPTTAQQIILSINGVIQKPNVGTGTPAEGFTLNGGLITLATAPPANSTAFAVIIGSSVNIGTPSAGTVNTLQLVNDSVTADKLQDHNSDDAQRAVSANHIKNGAVIADKLGTGAVTAVKLSPTVDAANDGKFLTVTGSGTTLGWAAVPAPSISNASTFTGDNNTTTFTIVTGHTVHSILVVLNGLVLRPTTDYTVSGTTLTFTSAPGTGDEIDVRYLPI